MKPIVAIVGRPNVGKSTLFNRLVGRPEAIVHDVPGVTRDRHYADAHVHGRDVTLVDTGGFDPESEEPLRRGIARGVEAAISEADVIVCVLDGTTEPTEADVATVAWLRQSNRPVIFVANKVDSDRAELEAGDLYELGMERLLCVSALHGRGMAQLEDTLVHLLPPVAEPETRESDVPHIAILGRPNAGKSSLFNRIAGTERSLVHDEPGTTVDPVDTRIQYAKREAVLVDTAGVRRKSRVTAGIELASVLRAIRAVERADVVVLLCDATQTVSEQDARLLGLCVGRARAVVVGLNKMDLIAERERKRVLESARDVLHFASWAPIVGLSAQTGHGVGNLMRSVFRASDAFHHRVPTAELNRFFAQVLESHPPPTQGGRAPRLYYITQAETAPPVFIVMSSSPEAIRDSYRRYVTNQIRTTFGFEAVPIVVHFRQKSRRE